MFSSNMNSKMFEGFDYLNLSEMSSEYSSTWPRYEGDLCLPVFISRAVSSSLPAESLMTMVLSMFPLIPYMLVLNSYSAAINLLY